MERSIAMLISCLLLLFSLLGSAKCCNSTCQDTTSPPAGMHRQLGFVILASSLIVGVSLFVVLISVPIIVVFIVINRQKRLYGISQQPFHRRSTGPPASNLNIPHIPQRTLEMFQLVDYSSYLSEPTVRDETEITNNPLYPPHPDNSELNAGWNNLSSPMACDHSDTNRGAEGTNSQPRLCTSPADYYNMPVPVHIPTPEVVNPSADHLGHDDSSSSNSIESPELLLNTQGELNAGTSDTLSYSRQLNDLQLEVQTNDNFESASGNDITKPMNSDTSNVNNNSDDTSEESLDLWPPPIPRQTDDVFFVASHHNVELPNSQNHITMLPNEAYETVTIL